MRITVKRLIKLARFKIYIAEKLAFIPLFGLRLWLGLIFWKSGLTKLEDWETTVYLFAEEYKVPVLSPEFAAFMSTAVELAAPVMLFFGFGSRVAATLLLLMTGVIEFTYTHHSDHIIWALVALLIMLQGPGKLSIDHWIRRRMMNR